MRRGTGPIEVRGPLRARTHGRARTLLATLSSTTRSQARANPRPPFLAPRHHCYYSELNENSDMDVYATKLDAILRAKEESLAALRGKLAAFQEQLQAEEQSRSQPRRDGK